MFQISLIVKLAAEDLRDWIEGAGHIWDFELREICERLVLVNELTWRTSGASC